MKLYKEGGELGLLDLASNKPSRSQRMEDENQTANGERDRGTAEKGHREGRESRTPTPTIRRDAHSGEGSRDPFLPGAKLSRCPRERNRKGCEEHLLQAAQEGAACPQESFSSFPLLWEVRFSFLFHKRKPLLDTE